MATAYASPKSVEDFYDELSSLERKAATTKQTGQHFITKKEEIRLKKMRKFATKLGGNKKKKKGRCSQAKH